MLARICCALLLLACIPAWCQEDASKVEIGSPSDQDALMLVPPPVSGLAYTSTFKGEKETNYLSGGVSFTTAWSSNVAWSTTPVSDFSYSVWPTIAMDKTTERMHLWLDYAPGFTFYQKETSLNQGNQNASLSFDYHFTPNLTANVQEGFHRTSNPFDQPNPLVATPVSGSVPVTNVAIIAPAADMLMNMTTAQLTYQVGANSMIGGGGNYYTVNYPNPDQVAGLYNSRSAGGSVFYSTRFHEKDYWGVSYEYQNSLSYQTNLLSIGTQTQTAFLFVTMYLKPNLSVSLSGGPQYYSSVEALSPAAASWAPMTMVSMHWTGERTALSASYARTVSGGGGLNGTFHSNNATATFSWRASRNWTAGLSGGYSNYDNLTPFFVSSSLGGHTLAGTASLQRILNEHANLQFGYSWTDQNYPGLGPTVALPANNRVFATINLTFRRPLQR